MNSKQQFCLKTVTKRLPVLVMLCVSVTVHCAAREPLSLVPGHPGRTVSQLSIVAGNSRSYDTYLSPSAYSGKMLGFALERMVLVKPVSVLPYRRVILDLDASSMHNGADLGRTWQVLGNLGWGRGMRLASNSWWDCMVGTSAFMELGGIYNMMNSNNPVDALFQASLGVTVDNMFSFSLLGQDMAARLSVDLPLVGVGFAPDHDQLYWTMYSDGTIKDNFHLTTLFNAWAGSLRATLVYPLTDSVLLSVGCSASGMSNCLGGNSLSVRNLAATVGMVSRFDLVKWRQ